MPEEGWSLAAAAEATGVSERRCSEWVRRYRHGDHELADRSSAARQIANKTLPEREEAIVALRELRFTAAQIAEVLGMAHSTVSAVLKRHGKGRLPRLDADEPERRYRRGPHDGPWAGREMAARSGRVDTAGAARSRTLAAMGLRRYNPAAMRLFSQCSAVSLVACSVST